MLNNATFAFCRTAHQPNQSVTHHLVSLARSAWQQLSQLLLQGPDAPLAQQQLQQLQQEQRRQSKKLKQSPDAANGDANGAPAPQQQQQQQDEMTALARAWRSVCGPNLGGFDAWVLLRQEALPFSARADPLATAQLQQQLKAQRRRCEGLLLSAMEAEAAGDDDDDDFAQQKGKKRKNAAAANGSGSSSSSGARGALVQLLHAGVGQVEAPKLSRAVLRSIPDQVRMHMGLWGLGVLGHTCLWCLGVFCSWDCDGCWLLLGVC
jgi:hypothetical protein